MSNSTVNEELSSQLGWFAEKYKEYANQSEKLDQVKTSLEKLDNTSVEQYFQVCEDPQVLTARNAIDQYKATETKLNGYRLAKKSFEFDLEKHQGAHSAQKISAEAEEQANSETETAKGAIGCLGAQAAIIAIPLLLLSAIFAVFGAGEAAGGLMHSLVGQIVPIAIIVAIFLFIKGRKKKKAETALTQQYGKKANEISAHIDEMETLANRVSQELDNQAPEVQAVTEQGMEQAAYLLAKDKLVLAQSVEKTTGIVSGLYNELSSSKIIPDEDDWFYSDEIYRMVRSGRASDLATALQLVDTDQDRKQVAANWAKQHHLQKDTIGAINSQTSMIIQATQAQIAQREQHHTEEMAQRELHRAQEAQEHARQTAVLAANLAVSTASAQENKNFHDEVRSQMNR